MIDPEMGEFLRACGLAGPLLLKMETEDGLLLQEDRPLHQPYLIIGRDERADLRLVDPAVSRRHAYFQAIGPRLFYIDLGSRTGVGPEGQPRPAERPGPGGELRIGPFRLTVRPGRDDAATPLPPAAISPALGHALPPLTLELRGGPAGPALWRANDELVLIGSAPKCWVHLSDSSVSRLHCSLVRTPTSTWVVDLLGRGGVRVDGRPVRFAALDDGQELRVGRFTIRVHQGSADGRPRQAGITHAAGSRPAGYLTPVPLPKSIPSPRPPTPPSRALLPSPPRISSELAANPEIQDLFAQVRQMQAEMAEQHNQSLKMAFQMFAALSREQASEIREHLDELSRLTRELNDLRNGRIQDAESTPYVPPQEAPPAASAPPGEASEPSAGPTVPPVSPTPTADNPRPKPTPRRPGSAASEDQIHSWLQGRLTDLQKERDDRWKGLLDRLLGR